MDVELVARLRGVISKLARQLNATSTTEGLTPTQYSVLGLIAVLCLALARIEWRRARRFGNEAVS